MASFDVYVYVDGVPINGNKGYPGSTAFEITSTGLILGNSQVWTYSGNLIFDGFAQLNFFPVGTTGVLSNFTITSNKYIYLSTRTHANYYKASYTDLSSIANAVRNKLGVAGQLEFPTDFVSYIGEIPSSNANTAVIDIDVANGTATIASGEFPDWCNESNHSLIWGSIYINHGFVAGDIDNGLNIECKVHNIFTNEGISSIIGFSNNIALVGSTNGLSFGIMTDLSMIGFITDPESDSGFIPMTSGSFVIVLIYCDPWSSGNINEPIDPIGPIGDDDPAV